MLDGARDVKGGALYADAIARAISNARAFVLVLSRSSIQSSPVGKEIERACAKQCPVIALRIDDAPLTPALEYFLSESQWIEAPPGNHNAAYERLIDSIRDPSKPVVPGAPLVNSRGIRSQRHRNRIWLAATIAVFAVAILAAGNLWLSRHPPARQSVVEPGVSPSAPILAEKSIAVSDYKKAVDLDPQGEVGRQAQGNILLLKGSLSGQYGEEINWLRTDQKRDPLDVGAFADSAAFEFLSGSLAESAADYRRLLELDSAFATAQANYGRTLLWMGSKTEALAQTEKETDDLSRFAELAAIYWAMDRRADSDAALDALKRGFADRNAYLVAATYAYRGEADAAFTWLDRAYQQAKGSFKI